MSALGEGFDLKRLGNGMLSFHVSLLGGGEWQMVVI